MSLERFRFVNLVFFLVLSITLFNSSRAEADVDCSTIYYDPMVSLSVGVTFNDAICQSYYQQYSFQVTTGRQYQVTISPAFTSDPDLYLHSASNVSHQNYTYSSNNRGTSTDSVSFTATTTGVYYAAVYGYSGEASGRCYYMIRVEELIPSIAPPTLSYPSNGAVLDDSTPDLAWTHNNASIFNVEIATDSSFNQIVCSDSAVPNFNYTPGDQYCSPLADDIYYWRVRAYSSAYGIWSDWSSRSFTVLTQQVNPSVSVSPSSGTNNTTFNVTGSGFTPSMPSTATLYLDTPDGQLTENIPLSSGSFSFPWTCNNCTPGNYQFWAVDDSTSTNSNVVSVNITSEIPNPVSLAIMETEQKVVASNGAAFDVFGTSVSVSDNYAIVGAPSNYNTLSAYIFKRDGDKWTQTAILTAGNGNSYYDWFGISVSMNDNYAIVGASGDNDNGDGAGAAYIFERSGESWAQVSKLTASDAAAGAWFGYSVAITDNYAIIGAGGNDSPGSAYIFKQDGSSWNQVAKLTASDGETYDRFGIYAVAITDNYAIVGADGDDDNGEESGSAYVFIRSGESWTQVAKLTASDGAAGDLFGASISMTDKYAAIGSPGDKDFGDFTGAAYIFERSGESWTQVAKLTASDGAAGDLFGESVAITDNYAIVGSRYDNSKGPLSGSAYLYGRDGSSCSLIAKLTASDGAADGGFGFDVSITDSFALVGAVGDDSNGDSAGAAYFYNIESAIPTKFDYVLIGSEVRQYDNSEFSFNETSVWYNANAPWFMVAFTGASGPQSLYPIYFDYPLYSNSDTTPYMLNSMPNYVPNTNFASRLFLEVDGFQPPGAAWEDRNYSFFIDTNENARFDSDEISQSMYIPQGGLRRLDVPTNIQFTGDTHPTISWDAVDGADTYFVSFYALSANGLPDMSVRLHSSSNIATNSYTYNGSLFEDGTKYAVWIQARQLHPYHFTDHPNHDPIYRWMFINRSGYFTTYKAPSLEPSVTVISPNGSETFSKNQDYTINWNSANISGDIQIDLYKGGTEPQNILMPLAAATENDGQYPFTPLDSMEDGSDYYIGISAEDGTVWDFGDAPFAIQSSSPPIISDYNASIQIYYPNEYYFTVLFWGEVTSAEILDNSNIAHIMSPTLVRLQQRPNLGDTYTIRLTLSDGTIHDVDYQVEVINDNFAWITFPADGQTIETTTPEFEWQAAAGNVDHYLLMVSGASGWIWIVSVPGDQTSCAFNFNQLATNDLQAGETYGIVMHSYDENGNQATTISSFAVSAGLLDSDEDGMPDDWEIKYGFDTQINDAIGNIDGDDLTNLQEYLYNTNPLSSYNDTIDNPDLYIALAKHYSPIIYQHVDTTGANGLGGYADLITNFNYDENWSGDVKWDNLDIYIRQQSAKASVYYSVVETSQHWFIYYSLYHPRDWTNLNDNNIGEHENDMEAITLMIRKGDGYPGNIVAAMSMSHNVWLEYPIESGIEALNYDGTLDPNGDGVTFMHNLSSLNEFVMNGHHPRVYVQSKGHGIFMDADSSDCLNAGASDPDNWMQPGESPIDNWNLRGFPGDDAYNGTGIVYYCSVKDNGETISNIENYIINTGGDQPLGADAYTDRWIKYQLLPMSELWNRKDWLVNNAIGKEWMFIKNNDSLDVFYGPKFGDSEARPPWTIPDYELTLCPTFLNQSITAPGEIFFDPLSAFPMHFAELDLVEENYINNPYLPPSPPILALPIDDPTGQNPININAVELKWERSIDPDGDAISYSVLVQKVGSSDGVIFIESLETEPTSFPLHGVLDPYESYMWIVTAKDKDGNTAYSQTGYFSTKDDLPPIGATSEHLILITHGWDSDANEWAVDMKDRIKTHLGDNADDWDIVAYDWSQASQTGNLSRDPKDFFLGFNQAYRNAGEVGRQVGHSIVNRGYKYVHFIAHSAGSNLIQTASEIIGSWDATVDIHCTFLDPYYPVTDEARYGRGVGIIWADNYIDIQTLVNDKLDTTDTYFENTHNFNVSTGPATGMSEAHGWPIQYYAASVTNSSSVDGYPLSLESIYSTSASFVDAYSKWEQKINGYPVGNPPPSGIENEYTPVWQWNDIIDPSETDMTTGDSGTVQSTPIMLILKSGSPVWASMNVQIDEDETVTHLQFQYNFVSDVKGVLTVYFDGVSIFRVNTEDASNSNFPSGPIWIGSVKPGVHQLCFRLDPLDEYQLEAEISNIQFGKFSFIDGDRDGFTVEEGDCDDISFKTNPGAEEIPDDGVDNNCDGEIDEGVVIHGDLNADGIVDQSDVNIIRANVNQPASVCPDCDIDGDGTISILDARKIVTMCTCPRCVCP